MGNRDRLIVTVVIWIMFAAVTGSFLWAAAGPASRMADEFVLGIIVALSAAVAAPTIAMWRNAGESEATPSRNEEVRQTRKSKRDQAARIQGLIERLDEDEIVELETLLQSREDEANWRR